jgi:hypothetical protein
MNLISFSLYLPVLLTSHKTYARRIAAFSLYNILNFLSLCSYTFLNQASLSFRMNLIAEAVVCRFKSFAHDLRKALYYPS